MVYSFIFNQPMLDTISAGNLKAMLLSKITLPYITFKSSHPFAKTWLQMFGADNQYREKMSS